ELTALADARDELANVHLDAVEHADTIRFMHAVQEGAANKSYGLQVAQLAGVPKAVIQQAKLKLHELENHRVLDKTETSAPRSKQLDMLTQSDEVRLALQKINPDELTPKMALEYLYQLKQLADA
ncbi:MAG: DNA mismatch repair protein MutS, partial [Paraglaciecola sp.]|nr:DNA mismatch repair protein MutS [Paraglaciecola sp.]